MFLIILIVESLVVKFEFYHLFVLLCASLSHSLFSSLFTGKVDHICVYYVEYIFITTSHGYEQIPYSTYK